MAMTLTNRISSVLHRYIYGFPIDYELYELYESYMAADKYLVHSFAKAFFDYVKNKLDAKSSCLIYDQLVKIGEREEIRLADVRTAMIKNSRETIESEHFKEIDQETLISLLSLDRLNIDEADLLAAVSKWVDCEAQRQGLPVNRENRRKVFQPIKSYILFTAFKPEKVAKCKLIADLLSPEEAGSLVLHLHNKDWPLMIELKTSRSAGAGTHSVFVKDLFSTSGYPGGGSRKVELTVDRRVSIRAIHLTYSQNATNLSFQAYDSSNYRNLRNLNLTAKRSVKDGKLCLSLSPPLDAQANCRYQLTVTCNRILTSEDQLTDEQTLRYGSITFDLIPLTDYSFVRGLEFVPLD